jgi:hypothetical protein
VNLFYKHQKKPSGISSAGWSVKISFCEGILNFNALTSQTYRKLNTEFSSRPTNLFVRIEINKILKSTNFFKTTSRLENFSH